MDSPMDMDDTQENKLSEDTPVPETQQPVAPPLPEVQEEKTEGAISGETPAAVESPVEVAQELEPVTPAATQPVDVPQAVEIPVAAPATEAQEPTKEKEIPVGTLFADAGEKTPKPVNAEEEGIQQPVRPARKKAAAKKKSPSADAAERQGKEAFVPGTEKQWYVVHTLSGQENKVKESMESRLQSEEMTDSVFQVLIPTENVSEVKSGKKTVTTRKFFPGYVLVNMILNEKSWYFIRDTSGVIGFIGTGKPVPLQEHEVNEILSQIEEKKEKVKPKVMFDVGENVKVNDGPFVNFTGTVEEVNPDRGKLKVVVSIFGRATPIELEYWQVERS